jgi:hypothetical protein
MSQTTLLPAPPEPVSPRRSSKGIAPGDIVEVDKKGRRFHALVVELEQGESGRFHLSVRPLDSRISYRQATVREVVAVWRRAGREARRPDAISVTPGKSSPPDAVS